jgi:mitogen-activated protein kinase 15
LAGHENIVRLYNVIRAENDRDLYLVFEYMETDLHAVIRAGILEEIHKQLHLFCLLLFLCLFIDRYIVYQAVKCLYFMHSGHLLHRDMKPSNLLLNSECHVKICDFGLARSLLPSDGDAHSAPGVLTDYVATRWCCVLMFLFS